MSLKTPDEFDCFLVLHLQLINYTTYTTQQGPAETSKAEQMDQVLSGTAPALYGMVTPLL